MQKMGMLQSYQSLHPRPWLLNTPFGVKGFLWWEPPTPPVTSPSVSESSCWVLAPVPAPARTALSALSRADLTLTWDVGSPVCWSEEWLEETQPQGGRVWKRGGRLASRPPSVGGAVDFRADSMFSGGQSAASGSWLSVRK